MPKKRDQKLLKKLGKRFQEIRLDHGWTQEDLSQKVGIEAQTLSRYENGKRGISITVLSKAAEKLGVDLADLLDVRSRRPEPKRTPDEEKLARVWKKLSPKQKDLVFRVLAEISK